MLKHLLNILSLFLIGSCSLFDIHPYDGKLDCYTNLNDKNIAEIAHCTIDSDTIRFAVIGDSQRWLDELEKEVGSINSRGNIDFVVHLGDITDFGITKEYEMQVDVLSALNVPFVVLLGNHDCLGNGREVFRNIFGKENFAFTAGFLRFVCIDTNTLEADTSEGNVPDFLFMKSEAERFDPKVKCTIVAMHSKPFSDELDMNIAPKFHQYVCEMHCPLFALNAHDHTTEAVDLFGDGFIYYGITCAKYREYYVFEVTKGGYSCESVRY